MRPRFDSQALEELEKPEFIGESDPEWAWQRESDFAGKSIGEIDELLRQQL
jgi:hypothetical protein